VKSYNFLITALLLSFLFQPIHTVQAQTHPPVVRAVLFYSPTCGHCEYVIKNVLLPLVDQYGDQLQIFSVDVTQQQGQALFLSTLQKFDLETAGVPFLAIDDRYLIGSSEIPEKFPELVKTYLAQGGIDWPDLPGLKETLNLPQRTPEPTTTPIPVVHAVLFYQGTCSHCQKIVQEVIPPLLEKYGNQLEIFGVDISTPSGYEVYDTAIRLLRTEKIGVPTLILGDHILVGGLEIDEQFPSIIDGYLNQGGVDWPDIPGLSDAILQAKTAEALTTAPSHAASPSLTATPSILGLNTERNDWRTRFAQDPVGNTLALLVLIGMSGSIVWAVLIFKDTTGVSIKESWDWIIPLLSLIGFAVAGYLAYVETLQVEAVCGPVGDCNTVQQSEYARLFGVLPIGVLGLFGYALIFIAWLASRYAKGLLSDLAVLSMFIMTAFGILLSIYLTFLEPFVIGASCAWCLSSAILMTLLMLLSVRPAKVSYARISQIQPKPLPGGTS
jgi:uncharacterized membrane protein/thiol-disulfide isomerase/thioredoxin